MFLKLEKTTKTTFEEKYLPGVIEPSYGIGRIIWAAFEHNFQKRSNKKDEKRTFFNFPAKIAPVKCSILPLMATKKFMTHVKVVEKCLKR